MSRGSDGFEIANLAVPTLARAATWLGARFPPGASGLSFRIPTGKKSAPTTSIHLK